jgi:serine/threonine protein kinase
MSAVASPRLSPGLTLPTERGGTVAVRSWRGEGSYARVYTAGYHPRGGLCALKVAKLEIEDAAERLHREKELLALLRHPRVVSLLDAGQHGTAPFLILEWLEGETCLDLVRARRRLPLRQALDITEAAAEGLAYIHSTARVHGDLRPQNVMIVPERGAVLTDPGAGDPSVPVTPADDIHALGGLLHLMLTGTAPGPQPALTSSAGHNRAAVQLWDATQAPAPPTAVELLSRVRRLRQTL